MSQYPAPYSNPQPVPQTHTMAIVSLIFGILGLMGGCPLVGAIIAVVTGNIAQREIHANPAAYTGDGLAKAGIILGWVGLGLMLIGLALAVVFGFLGFCPFFCSFCSLPFLSGLNNSYSHTSMLLRLVV
jgi:hypothetical protein